MFLLNYIIVKVVSSSLSEYVGETIQDEDLRSHYLMAQSDASDTKFRDETIFHSCAPVFVQGEWLGTLTIIWSSNLINSEVRGIIVNGILELFLIILVIGGVLYFAYRKNQSNIKIAYYDTLTGLPNAVYLDEYLNDKLHKSNLENMAGLLLNCRNFKMLNTTYGFKYGDRILNQISESVRSIIPKKSMFFRFNADRFVIVIENYINREELVELAQKVMDVFKAPFDGYGQHKYVDAEIAIFEVHDHNVTVDKILQDATLSLNNSMSSTHGHIIFFDQNMEVDLKRKDKIESTIRVVISGEDKESFYLEYQPKLDVNTNTICGFEALARLKIDTLGLVSPIEFIDLVEKRLLIYELGKYIIRLACDFSILLKNEGYKLTVAVNLSMIQLLRNEFIHYIQLIIDESGVDPTMLEFEITESIFLDNFEIINKKFIEIKQLGVTISLDDFGTGFSSFA